LVHGASAVGPLLHATRTVPIVFVNVADPVGAGFVASLARPGGNITGLSNLTSDIATKQVELLLGMVPKLTRLAVLVNPLNPSLPTWVRNIRSAAQGSTVTVLPVEAKSAQDIERAFPTMIQGGARAVIVATDTLFVEQYRKIAELAATNHLPSVAQLREYVEAGGLASYGPDLAEQYRRAATYVDRIFKGAKPGELPVEQSSKFELLINGKTANALGLTIPPGLRLQADRVIE
jgi:putative ABC transport system substrate-binding protein